MRAVVFGSMIYINFILESTIMQFMKIRQVKPNTALAITICYAALRGSGEGAVVGFFCGIIQDIFFGGSIGYYGLLYMTLGYLAGIKNDIYFKDTFLIPLLLCVGGTLLSGLFVYVTGFLLRGRLNFLFYFNNIILPETVYTGVISILVYRMLYGVNKKLDEREYGRKRVF